jgi:hypothetical protein
MKLSAKVPFAILAVLVGSYGIYLVTGTRTASIMLSEKEAIEMFASCYADSVGTGFHTKDEVLTCESIFTHYLPEKTRDKSNFKEAGVPFDGAQVKEVYKAMVKYRAIYKLEKLPPLRELTNNTLDA